MYLPNWIQKFKEPRTEIKRIKNGFYKYEVAYESYKQRNEIEVMFDSYKNYLDADVSYMQNRYVMEGWLFANFFSNDCLLQVVCETARGANALKILAKRYN